MSTQQSQQVGLDSIVEAVSDRMAEKVLKGIEDLLLQKQNDSLMTRKEVLEYLHITEATLWRWEAQGLIAHSGKCGARYYYKRSEVEAALANNAAVKKH